MKLTKQDESLIESARKVAEQNVSLYGDRSIIVGCALLAKSGKIYNGINIKTSHSICAEQIAIGPALTCGEREFSTIVSVILLPGKGNFSVVSPCGVCRYLFDKLGLDFDVIVSDGSPDKYIKVNATKLLPYPYIRK